MLSAGLLGLSILGGCTNYLDIWLSSRPNRYDRIYGYETFDYAYSTIEGARSCHFVWAVTGEPRPIPDNCVGCLFTFDVELIYDGGPYAGQSYYSDTSCSDLATSISGYTYAYSRRYDALLVSYNDVYYLQWLPASWELDKDAGIGHLTYGGGVADVSLTPYGDAYAGYYYTYQWYGSVYVQK